MASFTSFNLLPKLACPGITVLEVAIGMMLIGVIGVAVSNLVKTGVETQMSERMNQHLQTIGNDIVDDLRRDIRIAEQASVSGGGSQLQLTMNGQNILYRLNGTRFSKTVPGQPVKTYNDPVTYGNTVEVSCLDPQSGQQACFTVPLDHAGSVMNNSLNAPKQVRINYLSVQERFNGAGTVLDRAFGTSNYTLRNFGFNIYSATEFQ
jgi:hypothetical protein